MVRQPCPSNVSPSLLKLPKDGEVRRVEISQGVLLSPKTGIFCNNGPGSFVEVII